MKLRSLSDFIPNDTFREVKSLDPKKFGLSKDTVLTIVGKTAEKMRKANNEVFKPYEIHLSSKLLSEIVGKIFEKTASEVLTKVMGYEVRNAQSDADPDLMFTSIHEGMEVKVTSTETAWTGGEFSKRPLDYLLVSWGGDFNEFFVAFAHLEKDEWHSNITRNYYGPSYKTKDLYRKKDRVIFLGALEVTPRNAVRIKREKIMG